ncbi:Endoglucanase C [Agromyces sp. NDB4Y10]|uniref:glycoside hydrolase family 5 protein n=1 Tax=Agromyces sp. NDB4Y10 TaxID=1775951 RepID=UPI0007B311BD|nr:cellulase family glycosylhydrolase [Agromyces sp. NDB4Y10]KZE94715.1 Endoglucanase C [Agromyces sp. NDB4Y10]
MTELTGVNLGNWLVLEKWMAPELFAGTDAEDEWHLTHALDETARRERFTVHRDTWITGRDFAYLAGRGVQLVRLPVPYFVFGDVPPFVGCIEYVDRAFDWAERYGIRILLDLHTVPESQNGFDNGGICGVCRFHQHPEHVEFALTVLERLAARYGDRPGLWGIEVLNEPISPELWALLDVPKRYPAVDPERAAGSEGVPTVFLQSFYRDAYHRIRAAAPGARVVFHDGFRMREWLDWFDGEGFDDFAVDTHLYVMMAGQRDLDGYLEYIATTFGDPLAEATRRFPVIVGEWCLDTKQAALAEMGAEERRRYNRTLAEAHLAAFAPATAWTYWSWRMHVDTPELDVWDFLRATEAGYFPRRPGADGGAADAA